MNIDTFIRLNNTGPSQERLDKIHREKTAEKFEELFARQLVREMTRNSFQMADNNEGMGNGNSLYREFITEALAGKLASQRQLGLADLLAQHWDRQQGAPDGPESGRNAGGPMEWNSNPGGQPVMIPVQNRDLSSAND